MKIAIAFLLALISTIAFAQTAKAPQLHPVCLGDTIQASSKEGDWVLLGASEGKSYLLKCENMKYINSWAPKDAPQVIQGKTWMTTEHGEWTWFLYAPANKK